MGRRHVTRFYVTTDRYSNNSYILETTNTTCLGESQSSITLLSLPRCTAPTRTVSYCTVIDGPFRCCAFSHARTRTNLISSQRRDHSGVDTHPLWLYGPSSTPFLRPPNPHWLFHPHPHANPYHRPAHQSTDTGEDMPNYEDLSDSSFDHNDGWFGDGIPPEDIVPVGVFDMKDSVVLKI